MKNGLPSDVLLSIEEDADGNLWCATEEELCKFIPDTEKITNYPSRVFPRRINFSEGAALRTHSDYLMFNTVKGILYFFPDQSTPALILRQSFLPACSKRKRR